MASDNEKLWIEKYIETGDANLATREIFNPSDKNLYARTGALKAKLSIEIDKALRESMRINSVACHKILSNLAANSKSEQVQVKAAMDLLDRGGYKPVDKQEITETHSREDLEANLAQAASQLTSEDITALLSQLSPNELQALIKGTEH